MYVLGQIWCLIGVCLLILDLCDSKVCMVITISLHFVIRYLIKCVIFRASLALPARRS